MYKLISKIQYKNFEPGEFIDRAERNYDETIRLIEDFPWQSQREKIVIELTNPSITIEGENNNYLKLSVFFNHKYVLHYFDATQTLYTKSFIQITDAYQYIKSYFEGAFDTTDFKKENTWLQHNMKHFVSQDFHYLVTPKSTANYVLSTSGINLLMSLAILTLLFSNRIDPIPPIAYMLMLAFTFFFGGGLHLFICYSYFRYLKGKMLIMSRGNDTFYFGNIEIPGKYNKQDILEFSTTRSRGTRNQFTGFAVVEIAFKDGQTLVIPNLLLSYTALEEKLFEYPKKEISKFPWLRR